MTQRANWTRNHNQRILNKIVSYCSWILVHFISALLHISINGHGSQPHHAANLIRSILRSCVCVRLCVRILRPPHFAAAARFRKFKLCVCAHRLNHANCPRWIAHGRSSAALAILGFDMIMWCAHIHTHICVCGFHWFWLHVIWFGIPKRHRSPTENFDSVQLSTKPGGAVNSGMARNLVLRDF